MCVCMCVHACMRACMCMRVRMGRLEKAERAIVCVCMYMRQLKEVYKQVFGEGGEDIYCKDGKGLLITAIPLSSRVTQSHRRAGGSCV